MSVFKTNPVFTNAVKLKYKSYLNKKPSIGASWIVGGNVSGNK